MKHSTTEETIIVHPHQSPSRLFMIWRVLVLGVLASFAPLSIDMYLPALPNIAIDFKISTSSAQLSLTACLIGIALGQILAGPVSDVYGRKIPLLVGLFIYTCASLICVLATTIEIFITMRFIQGLAGSAGIVISRATVRDLYSGAEMTKFFSFLMLINGLAPILAPIFGGQILQFTSWQGVFMVLSGIGICMLVAVWLGMPETLPRHLRSGKSINNLLCTFWGLIKNRKFMGYALGQGFVYAALFAYIAGSPFVLQNIFGLSPQMFSAFFAINGLGIIIAGQITGRLAGRIHETKLLIAGLTMAACGGTFLLIMILCGGGLYTILLPLFFAVSSTGIVSTSTFSLAMQDQAKSAGSAAALIGLISFILGGGSAPLVGIAGSHTAVPMGIIIASAEFAAVLSYLYLVRHTD